MRILDINGNELISPDMEKGWLKEERLLLAHHEEVPEITADDITEYPNGGRSVRTVIVQHYEAPWDECEDILRYIEYTEEELAEIEERKKQSAEYRVQELESLLDLLLGVNDDE